MTNQTPFDVWARTRGKRHIRRIGEELARQIWGDAERITQTQSNTPMIQRWAGYWREPGIQELCQKWSMPTIRACFYAGVNFDVKLEHDLRPPTPASAPPTIPSKPAAKTEQPAIEATTPQKHADDSENDPPPPA